MDEEIDGDIDLEPTPKAKGNQDDGRGGPAKAPTPANDAGDDEPGDELIDDDGDDDESEPEETVEFEEGGRKYRVPKALQGHLLRQQEFSRKMNELATQRREFDSSKAELSSWREAEEADKLAVGRLAHVESEIRRFDRVNWPAFYAQNPQKAAAAQGHLTQLQTQRNQLKEHIEAGNAARETAAKTAMSERLRATREFAQAEIPGWTPERDKEIAKLAMEAGVGKEDLFSVMSPAVYKLLDLALTGQKYRAERAKLKAKGATQKADNVEPLQRVGTRKGAGAVGGLSDKASTDDWIAARNRQLRAKAR